MRFNLRTSTILRDYLAVVLVLALARPGAAGFMYAQSVTSSTGSFGTGGGNVGAGNPVLTLGPPDGQFIQFGDKSSLTLEFATTSSGPTLLNLFTADNLYPATARVEVSADNSSYTLVAASVSDTNGTISGNFHPSVTLSVDVPFQYVRITDLGTSPAPFQNLGFDLDAVGWEPASATVPEPSSIVLLGMGGVGFAVNGWRRRKKFLPAQTEPRPQQ